MPSEYVILKASTEMSLEALVNAKLTLGWILAGGISIGTEQDTGNTLYNQALYKA